MIRQKKAWKAFAAKYKLRYVPGSFSEAPQMDGVINDYALSFFPAQYEVGDVRHNRKMTAIELTLKSEMPFDGFIASGLLIEAAKMADLPHEFKPSYEGWNNDNIVLTDKPGSMQAYLTPARMDLIMQWMKMSNVWFILGFRNGLFILRVDIANPLDSPKKMGALVKKIIKDAAAFELDGAEGSLLRVAGAQVKAQPILSTTSESSQEENGGLTLELEDDEAEESPKAPPPAE